MPPLAGDVPDDAALIEACRNGDMSAYAQIVQRYQDRVFNLCRRMCGNAQDAEDFAQEAFVKALQSLDRFAERSRFYTWVFRIAVNVVLSARRKDDRHPTMSLDAPAVRRDDAPVSRGSLLAASDGNPHEAALTRERDGFVMQALAMLDDEQRTLLVLRDVESLSYDEIADILDVPTGTVKSRLHRARLALRDVLTPLLDPD